MMNRMALSAAIAVAALSSVAVPANATQIFTSNATIGGTTFGFGPSAAPWTAEVFAAAGECLRLAVITQGTDLKAVAVAPNGNAYRDDDGGGANRPLVKINGTPNNGWYTVSINQWQGNPVSTNFTLNIQRLGVNNAACLPATAPSLAATASRKASSSRGATAPSDGEPGSD